MKKRVRINGAILFLGILLVVLFPRIFIRPHTGRIDAVLRVAGLAVLLAGLMIRVSSRGYKSEGSRNGHALVVAGPYSVVRNPMYLGIMCIGAGLISLALQWWVLAAFGIFMLARYAPLIEAEEKKLSFAFGEKYAAYKKQTPLIIPRIGMLLTHNTSAYFPLRFAWMRRELSSVLFTPLAGLACSIGYEVYRGNAYAHRKEYFGYLLVIAVAVAGTFIVAKNYETLSRQK